jgi:excisionase family DNA binding protein
VSGRLLTTREVAARLGLQPDTVLRRWRAGELPGYRLASNVLRFDEAELDAWLEARHTGPSRLDSSPQRSLREARPAGNHGKATPTGPTRRG